MIFDRTISDAMEAIKIREEKVNNGNELTEEEIDILSRGFVTLETINRIERKQEELTSAFNDIGYYNTPTMNKTWTREDYFLQTDLNRIVKNNEILRKAFFIFSSTPIDARPKAYFNDFNKIERLLYDLDIILLDTKNRFKRCGTFNCGEGI